MAPPDGSFFPALISRGARQGTWGVGRIEPAKCGRQGLGYLPLARRFQPPSWAGCEERLLDAPAGCAKVPAAAPKVAGTWGGIAGIGVSRYVEGNLVYRPLLAPQVRRKSMNRLPIAGAVNAHVQSPALDTPPPIPRALLLLGPSPAHVSPARGRTRAKGGGRPWRRSLHVFHAAADAGVRDGAQPQPSSCMPDALDSDGKGGLVFPAHARQAPHASGTGAQVAATAPRAPAGRRRAGRRYLGIVRPRPLAARPAVCVLLSAELPTGRYWLTDIGWDRRERERERERTGHEASANEKPRRSSQNETRVYARLVCVDGYLPARLALPCGWAWATTFSM
ncbi:hypothetical protein CDD83_11196 [Cordyceps sp. RAO-2017]|nr:hypothetical protein CDD83_11196 [Cordyceps sp. RAO-2017]